MITGRCCANTLTPAPGGLGTFMAIKSTRWCVCIGTCTSSMCDVYGNPYILEPKFAVDGDGKSDYDNPYLFTGRRVDFFDNGNLTLQISRHRYYDYYTGRWLTQDKLGYVDGVNLYEYVVGNPQRFADPDGQAVVAIAVCGSAVTLTAAEAAAAAFGVSVATCMMIPDCRALAFGGAARAIVNAIDAAARAVGWFCRIRCNFRKHPHHHWWMRPRLGIPPWKKCYMKHVQVRCWSGSQNILRWQVPYGPCYKFYMAIPQLHIDFNYAYVICEALLRIPCEGI